MQPKEKAEAFLVALADWIAKRQEWERVSEELKECLNEAHVASQRVAAIRESMTTADWNYFNQLCLSKPSNTQS